MPVFRRRHAGLTPEEREARIAELRAKRRARLRWLAVRSALVAGVSALAGGVLVWWLLTSVRGRDVLLAQIVARLPAGTSLTWRQAEGPASGPLTLRGVRFSMPRQRDPECKPTATASCAMGRITFSAREVVLDPALRPLLGRRLRLDALDVRGAVLDLPRSDQPFELPRWPESLPDIAPPLALQADAIRVDALEVREEGEHLVRVDRARGGVDASNGRLHVEHLGITSDRGRFTLHGDYAPRDHYRSDLVATAVLPARPGRTAPRLGLIARGDLERMDVAVAGRLPAPLRATLTLRSSPAASGDGVPQWRLRARSDAFDPSLVLAGEPGIPLAFDLRAGGTGGQALLQGRIARGDLEAVIQPSRLALHEQILDIAPLVVDAFDGRVTLRGHADLRDPKTASLRFAVVARGLRWGGTDTAAPAIVADADFGIAGKPDAWAAIGKATLLRDGERARLQMDGRGNRERMALRSLHVVMPTGALDATGEARWSPQPGWNLDATLAGFDPGYFFPAWPGRVDGRLATRGSVRTRGGLDATLDVTRLGGRLRGRALSGHGNFALHGDDIDGELALGLGNSRIEAKGRIGGAKAGNALAVDARFAPLHLDDLLPSAAGTLQGTLALRGRRDAPDIATDLNGNSLRWNEWRADALQAHGRLPWRGGNGALVVDARGLEAGVAFDTLHVDARGAVEQLTLDVDARGTLGNVALAGNAARRGKAWKGVLASLRLAPAKGAQWRLEQAAHFRWDGRNGALSSACLASSGGGTLCADADWPRRGLGVRGNGLPLTLLTPYLPARSDDRPWLLRGEVAIDGQLRPAGNAWRGNVRVTSASGGLKNSERARSELVAYDALAIDARFDPQRIGVTVGAGFNGDGRVDARIGTGWDAYAPLSGSIALNTDELTWLELLSPDIVEPTGRLDARITLGGTRAQPALGGQAHLASFSTELPALAIVLQQGDVRLDALADGSARIHGSVRSGEGTLNVDGTLGWRGGDSPLVLDITGRNVLASDTRDLRAVVDPDVVVRYAAGQPLAVTGTVGVPSARMDLEHLDEGVSRSPDVVVLDPADPRRGIATPLDLDLTLALGDDVRLDGFGLDGTLGGRLRVRQRPGREMTAIGTLDVAGRYTAYGQKLTITRGELTWSNGPIADPLLDIRAEREVGDVTAGIQVSGRATAPQARVWSDPAMDDSEALAYLALGRPLSTASATEGRQIDAASAALSAGGSLLASQLGARIGLDEAGVLESRALGGSVFGVGKYLSPKLYVGYGVSLLGTGQVLTLKYLLRKGFDIEIESSTVENRASVNWRKEK